MCCNKPNAYPYLSRDFTSYLLYTTMIVMTTATVATVMDGDGVPYGSTVYARFELMCVCVCVCMCVVNLSPSPSDCHLLSPSDHRHRHITLHSLHPNLAILIYIFITSIILHHHNHTVLSLLFFILVVREVHRSLSLRDTLSLCGKR